MILYAFLLRIYQFGLQVCPSISKDLRAWHVSAQPSKHRSSTDWGEMIILVWLRPDEIVDVRESCKIPEFFEKSPLSGAGKHPDSQVTLCLHNVSTDTNFAYIKSE